MFEKDCSRTQIRLCIEMKMGWEAFCFPTWKNRHNWGEIKQRFFP